MLAECVSDWENSTTNTQSVSYHSALGHSPFTHHSVAIQSLNHHSLISGNSDNIDSSLSHSVTIVSPLLWLSHPHNLSHYSLTANSLSSNSVIIYSPLKTQSLSYLPIHHLPTNTPTTQSVIHPLTHSPLTYSLITHSHSLTTQSFIHPLTHSLTTQSLIPSLLHPFIYRLSFIYSWAHSVSHYFAHSPIQPLIYSHTHSPPTHSPTYYFAHSPTDPLIYSCTHSPPTHPPLTHSLAAH